MAAGGDSGAGRFQPAPAALGSLKQLRNEWKQYAISEKNKGDLTEEDIWIEDNKQMRNDESNE